MSLINSMMEPFIFMEQTKEPDGEGGSVNEWKNGMEFQAALTVDSSTLAKIAEKQGVTSTYRITTARGMGLAFPNVVKRKKDGQIFRITSNSSENKTPAAAGIKLEQVTAERWALI